MHVVAYRARQRGTVAATVLMSLAVVGCSGTASPSGAPASVAATPTTSEAPAPSSAAPANRDPLKLFMGLAVAIPFTQQIADGGQFAATQDGNTSLTVNAPTAFDPVGSIQAMEDGVNAGAQGVATHVFPPDVWEKPVGQLMDKGIPVVSITHGPVRFGDTTTIFVGENGLDEGHALGKVIADQLAPDAKGEILVTNCNPGLLVQENRVAGIRQEIGTKAPGISIPPEFDGGGDPTTNFSIWQSLVTAHPDAVALLGTCAFDLPNLIKLKKTTPNAKWMIGGVDLEPEALQGIKEGVATATIGQSGFLQGYLPIRILIEHFRNGLPVTPGGWIPAGTQVVTQTNVDQYIEQLSSIDKTYAANKDRIDKIFADLPAALLPVDQLNVPQPQQ